MLYSIFNNIFRKIKFFIEFCKNPLTIGAVAPSSYFLARKMAKILNNCDKIVVELGAGDGSVTKEILKKLPPDGKLISIEINREFIEILRENIDDRRIILIEKSAERINSLLTQLNIKKVDAIISGLPLVCFPRERCDNILQQIYSSLRPNGKFIQSNYSTKNLGVYKKIFPKIKMDFTPFNIPPAWVFICEK